MKHKQQPQQMKAWVQADKKLKWSAILLTFAKSCGKAAARHFKAHLIFNAYDSVKFLHIQRAPEQSCLGNTVPDAYYKDLAEVQ